MADFDEDADVRSHLARLGPLPSPNCDASWEGRRPTAPRSSGRSPRGQRPPTSPR